MLSKTSSPTAAICYGPMKSGKSRYLVQQAQVLKEQKISFLAFKPVQDTRDGSFIRSRDVHCQDVQALGVASIRELLQIVKQAQQAPHLFAQSFPNCPSEALSLQASFLPEVGVKACLIDEVFLFDGEIVAAIASLMQQGISVYLSGLDRDFRGEYFPLRHFEQHGLTMQDLIAACKEIIALEAHCEQCGQAASLTQRLINGQPAPYNSPTVLIGDEEYEPRCQNHHEVIGVPHSLSAVS